jgi:hypothetical protein
MRRAIAPTIAVAAGLVAANMIGVAAAEAPTTAPLRTLSVEGVATVPIAQGASLATATAVYRQGMAVAVADGQSKAEFLAGKVGATLGSVQNIAEGGGSIGCTGGDEESGYVEYQGEQPDFGSPAESATPLRAAAAPSTAAGKPAVKHHKKKHHAAQQASATACTLSTQVSLVFAIE